MDAAQLQEHLKCGREIHIFCEIPIKSWYSEYLQSRLEMWNILAKEKLPRQRLSLFLDDTYKHTYLLAIDAVEWNRVFPTVYFFNIKLDEHLELIDVFTSNPSTVIETPRYHG